MSARLFAWGLALALAAAGPSALAAGMPVSGTKNFAPAPATPSYFTDEHGVPYAGPQESPTRREIGSGYPTAAAPAGGHGDLYARPAVPATAAAVRRARPASVGSRHYRSGAERTRVLRLAHLRAVRLRRLRAVRLARARRKTAWRR